MHVLCGVLMAATLYILFQGSLELSDVAPHPLLEVVLQLEYVISWKSNTDLSAVPQSPRRGNAKVLIVIFSAAYMWVIYMVASLHQHENMQ